MSDEDDDLYTAADVEEMLAEVRERTYAKAVAESAARVAALEAGLKVAALGGLGADVVRKALLKGEWDESKHKRAEDGKFGSGGGSAPAPSRDEAAGELDMHDGGRPLAEDLSHDAYADPIDLGMLTDPDEPADRFRADFAEKLAEKDDYAQQAAEFAGADESWHGTHQELRGDIVAAAESYKDALSELGEAQVAVNDAVGEYQSLQQATLEVEDYGRPPAKPSNPRLLPKWEEARKAYDERKAKAVGDAKAKRAEELAAFKAQAAPLRDRLKAALAAAKAAHKGIGKADQKLTAHIAQLHAEGVTKAVRKAEPAHPDAAALLLAAIDECQHAIAEGEDPTPVLDALAELADDPEAFKDEVEGAITKAVPAFARDVSKVLAELPEEDLDGLYVYAHPDGPRFWIDQMDWHEGRGGKAVIAAAKRAAGVRDVIDHKPPPAGRAGVAVFNEGPKPEGDGWVNLLDVVRKAYDPDKHPRNDKGQFVSKKDIHAAQSDPAKAEELRAKVTDPEQRKKLDNALGDKSGQFIPAKEQKKRLSAERREGRRANRRTAMDLVNRLRDAHASGRGVSADDLHDLIPHLGTMTHDELSNVRTQLFRLGASFGGTRRLQDRANRLAEWARGRALEARMAEQGFSAEEADRAKEAVGLKEKEATPEVASQATEPVASAEPEPQPEPEKPTAAVAETPPAAATKKEPWQMTKDEWSAARDAANKEFRAKNPRSKRWNPPGFGGVHLQDVQEALDAGKPVPDEVRRQYAHLLHPHEMTQEQYNVHFDRQMLQGGPRGPKASDKVPTGETWGEQSRRSAVSGALAQGLSVPAEVLADYPDLAAKYAPQPPAAAPQAPAAAPAPHPDDAELAALNRTPAKQLTPAQRKRRDELSRAFTARKFPGATPIATGGGPGPGVTGGDNEGTRAAAPGDETATSQVSESAPQISPEPGRPASGSAGEAGKQLVRHSLDVNKDDIFATGKKRSMFSVPNVSVRAFEGANAVWSHQGDPNQTRFNAAQSGASDYEKRKVAEMNAARAAGYKLVNHRAGSRGTVWLYEKDGRILTERGARALVEGTGTADIPADVDRPTAKPVIDATHNFIQGLPESTRENLGALVNALNRSPLGKHVQLKRDQYGQLMLEGTNRKWRISEPSSGHDAQGQYRDRLPSSLPRLLSKLGHMAANPIPNEEHGWVSHDRAADSHAVANDPELNRPTS